MVITKYLAENNFNTATLYFVRSGFIQMTNGRLRYVSIYGYYWSLVASSRHNSGEAIPSAFDLGLQADETYPSNGPSNRWFGFPIHCQNVI